jgi:hypothetical protein
MTPEQKIKHAILLKNQEWSYDENPLPDITADNIDEVFSERDEDWQLQDATNELRGGEVETGLPCASSRHYESKSVAAKMPDGSWVGWTYWYGGGNHGEPEAVEWMDKAYDLTVTEEEKVVTVRTFAPVGKVSQP